MFERFKIHSLVVIACKPTIMSIANIQPLDVLHFNTDILFYQYLLMFNVLYQSNAFKVNLGSKHRKSVKIGPKLVLTGFKLSD